MAEYQLYCFAQSGNAYRVALMLNLIGADWEPVWVDFFGKGVQRTPEYRTKVNEMGEVPVLVHGAKKLSQSGVILTCLADRSGQFRPEGEDERLEALRWLLFDNQKVSRSPDISTTRRRNSASTSRGSTRTSRPGSSASRRCRAGSTLTTSCRAIRCRGGDYQLAVARPREEHRSAGAHVGFDKHNRAAMRLEARGRDHSGAALMLRGARVGDHVARRGLGARAPQHEGGTNTSSDGDRTPVTAP